MRTKFTLTKLIVTGLFVVTGLGIGIYPWLSSVYATQVQPPIQTMQLPTTKPTANEKPVVEVVFVLDTTGSMGGLIQTAKEKIWSIATTMASAQPAPEIKIGLVAYRDRGDAYVTQVTDLSPDLDSVYAKLMDYQAQGGGDGPESVNQALFDAVNQISWSQRDNVYKTIFLVGDAVPHMDYPDDVKYPQTLKVAKSKNIVVNAIQCGNAFDTAQQWQQIAQLGQGKFLNVAQAGSGIDIETPYDKEIALLSKKLEETKLYYGDKADREKQASKLAAVDKLYRKASAPALARRATFNASDSGADNFAGDKELVEEVAITGKLKLESVNEAELPEPLRTMKPEARKDFVEQKAKERQELNARIRALGDQRQSFIEKKVADSAETESSLDEQIYSVVKEQAAKAGLKYENDSAAY